MADMVNYYIRCMEGRRRLLFPALTRASGRLVTRYLTIIDVEALGPQHLGRDAWNFMRVSKKQWSVVGVVTVMVMEGKGLIGRRTVLMVEYERDSTFGECDSIILLTPTRTLQ